eukprot:GDKH01006305.1.p2 GENE.GDKH01006305.1~~GDKH01006305.1.p2  ORF type:complete len:61 (+),score=4.12 GDKH01006305.1:19-201(+)
MASVKAALPFILCMVFFGSMNTILTTWQNSTPIICCVVAQSNILLPFFYFYTQRHSLFFE